MVVLLLLMVAAILLLDHFHPLGPQEEDEQKYGFVVESAPKSTAKCERYETRRIGGGKVYLYLLRDSTKTSTNAQASSTRTASDRGRVSGVGMPTYGDTVVARTKISWYRSTGRAFAARYRILPVSKASVPLQVRLYRRLEAGGLRGDELATVGALTLGYKDDIDPEVRRHFQASGAAHVLAVSGLHTGIIYGIIVWILTLGGRFKPRYENRLGRWTISIVIIIAMWGYAWLTGMTPSVVRAVLMVSLIEIGRMIYRSSFSLNSIASAAVLILLVRPTDLWSVSFQLSFAATSAIVIIVNAINQWTQFSRLQKKKWGKAAYWVLSLMLVSIAAQLGTLPITMYNFGQISTYFLLTNLIVLPIATVLVPCGLVSIALGGSMIGVVWSKVTWALSWAMNHSVGWLESLPGSTVSVSIGTGMVVVYYILFIGFCIGLQERQGA